MAWPTRSMVISELPKAASKRGPYPSRPRRCATTAAWSAKPCSMGLISGCTACASSVGSRPSQNCVTPNAALSTVGALRVPSAPPTPADVRRAARVGEAVAGIVAGRAGDGPVGRQPPVEVQRASEIDPGDRQRVLGRDLGGQHAFGNRQLHLLSARASGRKRHQRGGEEEHAGRGPAWLGHQSPSLPDDIDC